MAGVMRAGRSGRMCKDMLRAVACAAGPYGWQRSVVRLQSWGMTDKEVSVAQDKHHGLFSDL